MIGRVYRGSKVGGLVRYLYGPGRHNEHVDQRLVACWSGADPQVLAAVEPEWTAAGERDYRGLIAELEAPMAYAERMDANPVWHCPLRTAPGDRVLTDAEWADIAADLITAPALPARRRGRLPLDRGAARRREHPRGGGAGSPGRRAGAVFRDYLQVRAACLGC